MRCEEPDMVPYIPWRLTSTATVSGYATIAVSNLSFKSSSRALNVSLLTSGSVRVFYDWNDETIEVSEISVFAWISSWDTFDHLLFLYLESFIVEHSHENCSWWMCMDTSSSSSETTINPRRIENVACRLWETRGCRPKVSSLKACADMCCWIWTIRRCFEDSDARLSTSTISQTTSFCTPLGAMYIRSLVLAPAFTPSIPVSDCHSSAGACDPAIS